MSSKYFLRITSYFDKSTDGLLNHTLSSVHRNFLNKKWYNGVPYKHTAAKSKIQGFTLIKLLAAVIASMKYSW